MKVLLSLPMQQVVVWWSGGMAIILNEAGVIRWQPRMRISAADRAV